MRRYVMSALVLVPLAASAARADFVVAASRPPVSPSRDAPPATSSPEPSESAKPTDDATAPGAGASMEPRFRIARGFGNRVPLGFAVRQIVPNTVKVTYGRGADRDALVDWKGGEGWNRVLARAVHPLGLRLVMTQMAVQIRE